MKARLPQLSGVRLCRTIDGVSESLHQRSTANYAAWLASLLNGVSENYFIQSYGTANRIEDDLENQQTIFFLS